MALCPRDKDGCSIGAMVVSPWGGGERAPWLPRGTPVPMNSPLPSPGTGQESLSPGTARSPCARWGEQGALGFFPHQPTSCYAPKMEPLGCSLSPAALAEFPQLRFPSVGLPELPRRQLPAARPPSPVPGPQLPAGLEASGLPPSHSDPNPW